jgi:Fusaric acid resistance protein-like/Aromatic acid exporter family member 2
MEYSFLATARGILDLVKYADSKVDDGTMKRKRLIFPSWKRMQQWFWAALSREDSNLDYEAYSTRSGTVTVYLRDALQTEKDAEHLPPVSTWEKATDKLRLIPHFFGSPESAFGFRVATGTIVIAIVCYLRNSQHFYIEQRLIWSSIMVAISMTQTAGSGIYGQFLRFAGTALAMVASYIDWYIVDQHTAGIIVFVGITMFLYHYLLVTRPENPVLPMIGMVTVVLIVGYALQVRKVGLAISESNGQQYHPLYELAPYRLAAVGGGVAIAFFFTYFPSVVTARSQLRKDLGSSLYLLAHYYSSVHTTVSLRIRGTQGDLRDKKSPGRVLEKARTRVLAKELVLLQGMKQHCEFIAWEPAFGGKFPRDTYDKLIKHTQKLVLLPFQFRSQWLGCTDLGTVSSTSRQ